MTAQTQDYQEIDRTFGSVCNHSGRSVEREAGYVLKLLIASDIHGSANAMRILMDRIKDFEPDNVVLLGDLLYHGPRNDLPEGYAPKEVIPLLNSLASKAVAVRGNCDAEVDQMVLDFPITADYQQFSIDGHNILATHGHVFDYEALPVECQTPAIFMSGHTHIKVLERREDGLVLLNPGSVSIPKDGSASYATYEDGTLALRLLDGTVIAELTI